jgi:hypothetical protein
MMMCVKDKSFRQIRKTVLMTVLLWGARDPLRLVAQVCQVGKEAGTTNAAGLTDSPAQAARERGEWIVAAYFGGAHTASSRLTISQPPLANQITFEDVAYASRSFDGPLYYGIRGGYFVRGIRWLGVGADFIHLKVFAEPGQRVKASGTYLGGPINHELPLGEMVQQYSISHGVNLLLFNVAVRYPAQSDIDYPFGRLVFTGRFGIGPTLPHTESTINGKHQEQYELGRLGWQLAGGAELHLWRGLYSLGEYKFTRTRQRGKIFTGAAESLLRTHHAVLGFSYHF